MPPAATRRCCAPPSEVRRNVDVFHPQQSGLAALGERVRHSFDPKNILNRGRMIAGIGDMKTEFSLAQLADPDIAEADKILRACVHCGFCTATCPTYVLLGDELDSPRGRIYLIKEMLEKDRPPTPEVVKHIDRCLSCLACMTTCPSGVNYMHLVDQARVRIEKEYTTAADRAGVARGARLGAAAARAVSRQHDPGAAGPAAGRPAAGPEAAAASPTLLRRIKAMLALAPSSLPRAGTGRRQRLSGRRRKGADGSRCCRAAPSRCWRRASTRPPSIC